MIHFRVNGGRRALGGWHRDMPDHRDLLFAGTAPTAARADLSGLVTRIEDQQDLGSCVANSCTSAAEALGRKLGLSVPELSRLFVYYYARKIDGTLPTEDIGCSVRSGVKCLSALGAPGEDVWPYDIAKFSTPPTWVANKFAAQHRVTKYFRCPTLLAIRRSLSDGFTVVGGFSVPAGFMDEPAARTGIVPQPDSRGFVGGHAIHFVGYDDATKQLKFQNSWGAGWGDHGFGYLPYDFVERGLADDFWTLRRET